MDAALAGAAVNNRLQCLNDTTLQVTALRCHEVYELAEELRRLNGESERLLEAFRQGRPI
jgi:hypothetical protein